MKGKLKRSLAILLTLCICFGSIPFALGANAATTVTPKVAAGKSHTLVLGSDGSVWAAGDNTYGKLGIGSNDQKTSFSRCKDSTGNYINDAVDVAAGYAHSIILRSDGTVWASGRNNYGQLGDGTGVDKPSFVKVASGIKLPSGNYNTIACGDSCTAIIKTDGYLYTCGNNFNGQLGLDGDYNNKPSFAQVTSVSNVVSVACGSNHTAIIDSGGTLYTCGYSNNGQLGRTFEKTPMNTGVIPRFYCHTSNFASVLSSVSAVSCGNFFTVAISNGNLYKSSGGDTDTAIKTCPGSFSQVEPNVSSVSGYGESYSTLKSDGTLYTNGTDTGISNVASIATGPKAPHSVIVKKDGSVYVKGTNSSGQLGTGDTSDVDSYTQATLPINDATINVSNNSFKSFINSISFGYFFKDSATVSISATQGIDKTAISNSNIKYYVSDTAKSEASLPSVTGWKDYTGSFSLNASKKQIVYAKITSAFGNTKYISSNGLVIYNPVEVTYSNVPDFVQTQSIDIDIPLKLNGNTFAGVTKDGADIGSSNYSANDSTLTIKNAYLKALDADKLTTLAISYNPIGVSWTDSSNGDKPEATEFQINIISKKLASATISVDGNEFTSLVEKPEFKYFFKENASVSITAKEQNGDAVPNSRIAYYISDEAKNTEQLKALTDWTNYTGTINIPAASKKIVYAKITDYYEGTNYFSSNGLVVYAEPKVTKADESQYFAKTNNKDTTVNVELNDSEIADILLNGESIDSTHYSIEGSTITLSQDYLKNLKSNEDYTFTIVYSALGQTWGEGSQGSQPTSTFKLRVVDSQLTDDPGNNSASYNVVGTANFQSLTSITIDWGSLIYSYSATWDPTEQKWVNTAWQHEKDADKITIENNSSQGHDLVLDFKPKDEYDSTDPDNKNKVVGTFVKTSGDASTKVPNSTLNMDRLTSETVYLQLDGMNEQNFSKGELTNEVFGVVTITVKNQ